MNDVVRVRFAPSPTGYLHLGGARVAIFNWLFSRHFGGKFLLRIEDTDTERSKPEYAKAIIESLEWMGMSSDEPVVVQSSKNFRYLQVANDLISKNMAYRCYCTTENLDEMREEAQGFGFRYPETCRNKKDFKEGQPYTIRLALPALPEKIKFLDLVKGEVEIFSSILDDFVIVKSNGVPTYNFAVVIDDVDMKISHVIRGEDHLVNTFKQLALYQIINEKPPLFGHLPMILAASGERLSKRFGAVSITEYQNQGFLPEAMFNYLVRLGWSHGNQEIFTAEELIKFFSLEGVGAKNAVFDVEKLSWLNGHYLKKITFQSFLQHLPRTFNPNTNILFDRFRQERLEKLFDLYKSKFNTTVALANRLESIESFWEKFDKKLLLEKYSFVQLELLRRYLLVLVNSDLGFNSIAMQQKTKQFLLDEKIDQPTVAKPLRFALTGSEDGPSIFLIAEAFGRDYLLTLLDEI